MKIVSPVVALVLMISGCASIPQNHELAEKVVQKPTLVFVHGAHLTAKSWLNTENILKAKGFDTLAVDLPGRNKSDNPHEITLNASSKALCDSIKSIDSSIVFVAHSQGGAVSNNALSICPKQNIKGMVYIAAVAPADGEKPFALLNKVDESNYFKGVSFDEKSGWMKIKDKNAFTSVFTNSKSNAIQHKVMSQSVNEPAVIGDGVVHYHNDYFSKLNKFYIHTKFDKIISLTSQQKIASKIELNGSTVLDTGHLPMLSAPEKLANHIEQFVN